MSTETVPKGYKRTEVGVIPEEWEVKQLSATLAKGRLGGNYPNSIQATAFPLMKMGNISRGVFDLNKIEYIPSGLSPDPIHQLTNGDVLFNTRNSLDLVGKVAIWRGELPVAYYNSNLMRLEFDSAEICSNDFANYYLNAFSAVTRLRALAIGTTSVAAIYGRDLRNLMMIVPPKAEQQAIAAALSDADALIESLEQLIVKKRQIKQGAMQDLLKGKRRLPGFSGNWESFLLGDVIDLLTGFPFPSSGYASTGVRLLRGSNVKRNRMDWSEEITQYWPSVTSEIRKFLLDKEDIVISMDGSLVGKSFAVIAKEDLPSLLLQRVARVRGKNVDQGFLRAWICSPYFTSHCDGVKTVTAIPHISPADIRSFPINAPPTLPEQVAIAAVLSDMDTELESLEGKLDKARQVKQGMMQQLLTGKVRLV